MSRSRIVMLVGLFVLALGIGFGIARTQLRPSPLTDKNHVVELKANKADPSVIAVTQGDYVQFNSKDGKKHNIAQGKPDGAQSHGGDHTEPHDGKGSGTFGADEGYRVQFEKTGTYEFHDRLNPKLAVTVIVYKTKQ